MAHYCDLFNWTPEYLQYVTLKAILCIAWKDWPETLEFIHYTVWWIRRNRGSRNRWVKGNVRSIVGVLFYYQIRVYCGEWVNDNVHTYKVSNNECVLPWNLFLQCQIDTSPLYLSLSKGKITDLNNLVFQYLHCDFLFNTWLTY